MRGICFTDPPSTGFNLETVASLARNDLGGHGHAWAAPAEPDRYRFNAPRRHRRDDEHPHSDLASSSWVCPKDGFGPGALPCAEAVV
jgi:hypothetical protein